MAETIKNEIMEAYGQAQILVVDDSAFSRSLIVRELFNIGFGESQVHQADSGETALEKIREKAFDLFIIDIVMKDVDGIAVLEEVKRMQPAAKIIMCSSWNSEEAIRTSVAAGIDAFVVKPHTSEVFQKVLQRIWLRRNGVSGTQKDERVWHAKCHICDQEMIEINATDMVSFFCPKSCMKLGPWSVVLVKQEELDQAYAAAKTGK